MFSALRFALVGAFLLATLSALAGGAETSLHSAEALVVRELRPTLVSRRVSEIHALLFETSVLQRQLVEFVQNDPSASIEDPAARLYFERLDRRQWLADLQSLSFRRSDLCLDARGVRQPISVGRGRASICVDPEFLAATLVGSPEKMSQALQGSLKGFPPSASMSPLMQRWVGEALGWDDDQEARLERTSGCMQARATRAFTQGLVLSVLAESRLGASPRDFATQMSKALRRHFPLQSLLSMPRYVTLPSSLLLEDGLDQVQVRLVDRTANSACSQFSGYFSLWGYTAGDRFPGLKVPLKMGELSRISLREIVSESSRPSVRFRLGLASVRLRPMWWDDEKADALPEGLANCELKDLTLEIYDGRGSFVTSTTGHLGLPDVVLRVSQ